MKTVILCGGYGTRIRDVAEDIPKPMIPIGGIPILWHIMKYYANWDFKDFVLCLGYKGQVIKDFFLNYHAHTRDFSIVLGNPGSIMHHTDHLEKDWKITLSDTGIQSMTGARIKKIKKYVFDEDNFMVTYGDGVGNVDLGKLINFHIKHGKILTVTGVRPPGRFGELLSDNSGRVREFNEKPQAGGGMISGGFFVCRKKIFDYLNDQENLVFEQEPMQQLVKDNEMMVWEHNGFWHPMDTYRDYLLLNSLYEKGDAPWVIW